MESITKKWNFNVRYASHEALSAFKDGNLALLFHQFLYLHEVSQDFLDQQKVIHITRDHLLHQMPNYSSLSTLQRHIKKLVQLGILSIVNLKRGKNNSEKGFCFSEKHAKEYLVEAVNNSTQVKMAHVQKQPKEPRRLQEMEEKPDQILNTGQNDLCSYFKHESKWPELTLYIIYIYYLEILDIQKIAHARIVQLLQTKPDINQEFESFWSVYINGLGTTQCQKSEALKKWKALGKSQKENVWENLYISIASNLLLKDKGEWIAKPKHQSTYLNTMKHCADGIDEIEFLIMTFDENLKTNPKTKFDPTRLDYYLNHTNPDIRRTMDEITCRISQRTSAKVTVEYQTTAEDAVTFD